MTPIRAFRRTNEKGWTFSWNILKSHLQYPLFRRTRPVGAIITEMYLHRLWFKKSLQEGAGRGKAFSKLQKSYGRAFKWAFVFVRQAEYASQLWLLDLKFVSVHLGHSGMSYNSPCAMVESWRRQRMRCRLAPMSFAGQRDLLKNDSTGFSGLLMEGPTEKKLEGDFCAELLLLLLLLPVADWGKDGGKETEGWYMNRARRTWPRLGQRRSVVIGNLFAPSVDVDVRITIEFALLICFEKN